jgi:hypothetical protein
MTENNNQAVTPEAIAHLAVDLCKVIRHSGGLDCVVKRRSEDGWELGMKFTDGDTNHAIVLHGSAEDMLAIDRRRLLETAARLPAIGVELHAVYLVTNLPHIFAKADYPIAFPALHVWSTNGDA